MPGYGDLRRRTHAAQAGQGNGGNGGVIQQRGPDDIKLAMMLLGGMDGFVERYAGLAEDSYTIKCVHKMVWNDTVYTTVQRASYT